MSDVVYVELARIPTQLKAPTRTDIAVGVFMGLMLFSIVSALLWFMLIAALMSG